MLLERSLHINELFAREGRSSLSCFYHACHCDMLWYVLCYIHRVIDTYHEHTTYYIDIISIYSSGQ